MTDRISPTHRSWLAASMLLVGVLGAVFLLAPDLLAEQLELGASDRAAGVLRVASSVLLAESIVVGMALRSGSWSGTKYVTYLLVIHFAAETLIRLAVFSMGESGSLAAAIPQAVLAAGLGREVYRRRGRSLNAVGA